MANEQVGATGSVGPVPFVLDKDASNGYWPYAKIAIGASGTQTPVSAANPLPVTAPAFAATLDSGRHSVATGSATALPTVTCRRVHIKRLESDNDTLSVDIGKTGVTVNGGWSMPPGSEKILEVANLNQVFAIASGASQSLCYLVEV